MNMRSLSDAESAWQTEVMGTKPNGNAREQMTNFVREAAALGIDRAVVCWALTHWQYKHCDFVNHGDLMWTLVEELPKSAEQLHPEHIVWPFTIKSGPRKGQPSTVHHENTAALIKALDVTVRYNLMTHELELEIKGYHVAEERRSNANIHWFRTRAERFGLNRDRVLEHLHELAIEYHPVRDWITSTPWDGTDRISELVDTVDTCDPLAPELLKRWLRQCVAAILGAPDFRTTGVLTYQGPQGCGKTTWCERLAPEGTDWIAIGMRLDPSDRDSIQALTRHWIAELGELDATYKIAEIASLKSFVDRPHDVYRAPYARRTERVPRRTVLFASVNRPDVLADDTGNRRWWVIQVRKCNWNHGIDVQQLWAQVYEEVVEQKLPWRLDEDQERQLRESNARFEAHDPLAEAFWSTWEPTTTVDDASLKSLRQILEAMPGYGDRPPARKDTNAVLRVLRLAGAYEKARTGHAPVKFGVRLRGSSSSWR